MSTATQTIETSTPVRGDMRTAEVIVLSGLGLLWLWTQYVTVDHLRWFLQPTVTFVSLSTGHIFSYVLGQGFVRNDGLVLIHKGCAGLNFFLMTVSITWVHFLPLLRLRKQRLILVLLGLVLPVLCTMFANTSRIVLSLRLEDIPLAKMLQLSPSGVHFALGLITYLTLFLLYYFMLRRLCDAFRTHH